MSKTISKTDQTKYDIKCAFLQLLEEKKPENITVKEISEISGYHRSTFYLYFKNMNDLLDHVQEDLLSEFNDALENELSTYLPKTVDEFTRSFVNALRRRSSSGRMKPLVMLLGENVSLSFANALKKNMIENMLELEQISRIADDDEREYLVEFLSTGFIAVIRKWVDSGMSIPLEQALSYLFKFVFSIVNHV